MLFCVFFVTIELLKLRHFVICGELLFGYFFRVWSLQVQSLWYCGCVVTFFLKHDLYVGLHKYKEGSPQTGPLGVCLLMNYLCWPTWLLVWPRRWQVRRLVGLTRTLGLCGSSASLTFNCFMDGHKRRQKLWNDSYCGWAVISEWLDRAVWVSTTFWSWGDWFLDC